MTDIVDNETRSKMMSGIRGKNTKPEIIIRKGLHARGFRYRLYSRKLPGKPDIVLPKYKAIILINGCFWHQHNCHLFKWPSTRTEFWEEKLLSNVLRDKKNIESYQETGWKTLVIWECALKGKAKLSLESILDLTEYWVMYGKNNFEIHCKMELYKV